MSVRNEATGLAKAALRVLSVLAWLVFLPAAVFAQGSIAGVVKDAAGTVVAGVTVEASSPVLIEGKRTVTTNASGVFEIVNLGPGTYAVTFSAAGFSTVRHEGLSIEATATVTSNATMEKGSAETVRVVAQAETVDVRSAGGGATIVNSAVLDNVPTSRLVGAAASAVEPSISVGGATTSTFNGMGSADSGGSSGDSSGGGTASAHGSTESQVRRAGLLIGVGATYTTNPSFYSVQASEGAGATGEAPMGGVKTRLVPKDGGNTFKGNFFATYANQSWQSDNLTDALKTQGLLSQNRIKRVREENPGFGGPIVKNKLWFYTAFREQIADNYVAGAFADPYQLNPKVFYDPNNRLNPAVDLPLLTVPLWNEGFWKVADGRVTYQATPRDKVSMTAAIERWTQGPSYISANQTSGVYNIRGRNFYNASLEWTSVVTRRLLLEVAARVEPNRGTFFPSFWYPGNEPNHPDSSRTTFNPNAYPADLLGMTESTTGIGSKLWNGPYSFSKTNNWGERVAVSYVTGTHSFKVGFENYYSTSDGFNYMATSMPYRYTLTKGAPTQITEYAAPYSGSNAITDANMGVYVQDRWTSGKLTLTGGLRFDYFKSHFPEQSAGPSPLTPLRNVTFPESTDVVGWKDLSPRVGVVYDIFGNGKTAVRGSLSRYVTIAGSGQSSPLANMVNSVTRTWTDDGSNGGIKGDFIPQCDLTNVNANGECKIASSTNFGTYKPSSTYDPDRLAGFGVRSYNWEFSISGTHQVFPRLAINVGYFRRWFGNLVTTDNLALSPSDFATYSIVAPLDPKLPGGGGYTLSGLYNQNVAGIPTNNFVTNSSNYGGLMQHWNGFDFTANVPLKAGMQLRGGASSGRTSKDSCAVQAALPELIAGNAPTPLSYCHSDEAFQTRANALFSYTIPKVALQVSGTWTNNPGPLVTANFVVPNSDVQKTLGRPLSGGTQNVTINLINPDKTKSIYGDRYSQVDLRVARNFQLGSKRINVNLGAFNLTNAAAVTAYSAAYAQYLRPQITQLGRFYRVGTQFDF